EALPGFLAAALRERHPCGVTWSVAGKNGATARKVFREIVPSLNGLNPDIIVITIGVNDLMRRRPLRSWSLDLTALIAAVRGKYANAKVILAGMPPVHRFPALPQPLRSVMGGRARAMDRVMQEVARTYGALHVPMFPEMAAADPALFASDGFHPSPAGYRLWAQDLAKALEAESAPFLVPVIGTTNGTTNGNGHGNGHRASYASGVAREYARTAMAGALAVEVKERST
ncbi:SGNH/GDSL hydrolase family protein, partial [Actinomadura adrarensis]